MLKPVPSRSSRTPLAAACLLVALVALLLAGGAPPPETAEAQTVNRKPVLTASEPGFRTISENAAIGTAVGDPIAAVDPDGHSFTYQLVGTFGEDTTTFSIDANTGQLTTNVPLDFESNRVINLLVDITDAPGNDENGNPIDKQFHVFFFTVVILDADEPPVITRTSPTTGQSATDATAFSLETNTVGGTVASFSASDPEGDAIGWSVSGTDANDFSIDSAGNLSLNQVLDVSNPTDADGDNVYEVTVLATDSGGNVSAGHDVVVTATAPATGIEGPTNIVRNEGGTSYVGFYSLRGRPANSGNGRWVLTGDDAGDFTLESCANQNCPGISGPSQFHYASLRFRNFNPPDFSSRADKDRDNVFEVNVEWRYGSPEQSLGKLPVTVKIYDVGGAPRVTRAYWDVDAVAVSVSDGEWLIAQDMKISDPDSKTLDVVVGGPDGHLFKAADQGFAGAYILQIKIFPDWDAPIDHNKDNVYEVIVKAHNGDATSMLPWRLTVNGADEKPRLHGPTKTKFEVGSTATVATFIAGDDEGSVTLTLEGTNASLFSIDSSGNLTYDTAPTAAATHTVTVKATDSAGKSAQQALTVTVVATGTNTAPGAILGPGSKDKAENSGFIEAPGDVGSFRITSGSTENDVHEDSEGDQIYWSLSGDDAEYFWIGHNGKLRLIKNMDFENPGDADGDNVYEVTVNATDGIDSVTKAVTVTATDVNEPPLVTGDLHVEVADGSTTVASYTATNPEVTHDTPQTVTWSVVGKDADDFSISSSGVLTFSSAPSFSSPADADTDNVYHVVVKATDNGTPSDFDTLPVTVTVTGNNAPTVTSGPKTKNHAENSDAVIGTYAATDADGDPITWSLSGNDANLFMITGGGVLSFRLPPDFETKRDNGGDNVYNVTVNAGDGTATDTRDVAVTVTDVNEVPVVTGPGFAEVNAGATDLTVATFTAADPEGDTSGTTWDVVGVWNGSSFDHVKFEISETGVLSFKQTPEFEGGTTGDSVFLLTVRATIDSQRGDLLVAVGVKQQNPAPTFTSGPTSVSFDENQATTTIVGTYVVNDPGDTITWSLSGDDASAFTIDGGVLRFKASPDHETKDSYSVNVVATDSANQMVTRAVTVTVTDVQEGPVLSGDTGVNFAENTAATTTVATYTASDPEGDTVSLALSGTDSSSFTLSAAGALTFNSSPDFEAPPCAGANNAAKRMCDVTITAMSTGSDNVARTDRINLTVTVTNVNEPPVWGPGGPTSMTIEEGNRFVGNYRVTDPDGTIVTWSLSGDDASHFESVTSASNFTVLRLENPADYETKSSYSVTIEANDGANNLTRDVAVTISNVDEAGTVTVPASPQVNGPVTATLEDLDGGVTSVTWQWKTVDESTDPDTVVNATGTGATTATYTPGSGDQGKKLRAVASYTDDHGSGKSATGTSANAVGARSNAAPTFTNATETLSTAENTASGSTVGAAITASDTDTEDANALVYSLESLGTAPFTVNASTGQISTNGALDFEASPSHTFTLKVTDGPGATDTVSVTVNVTDVEETGSVTFSPATINIGTTVTASVDDGDGGVTSETWQWQRGDGSTFSDITGATSSTYMTVTADSGKRLRVNATYRDRRSTGSTNDKSATGTTAGTVGNSAPTMSCTTTSTSVAENSSATIVTYQATDPEGQSITWSVTGTDADDFTVSGGALTWASAPNFESAADSDGNNVYSVTVAASDGTKEATCTLQVTVTDVDEAGTLTLSTTTPEATVAVRATLSDPEGTTSPSWQWSLRENGTVTDITGATSSSYTPQSGDIGKNLRLTVTYTDTCALASCGSKTLTVDTDAIAAKANRPPVFSAAAKAQTALSVAENTPSGRNLGSRYTATDADNETLTYSLSGGTDDDSFSINANTGQLQTKAALDFETKTSYSIRIRVVDPNNEGDTVDVTITVTNVDEAPEYIGDAVQSYDETRTGAVATFTATDPEGGSVTWVDLSGTDAADFSFNKGTGVLTFVNQPDFENPADSGRNNVYNITLGATDANNNSSQHRVTVTVVNIDEAGAITFPILQPQVTVEFVAELSDPDGGVTNVRWQWSIGATGSETDITGATRDRYEPRVGDIGSLLHVGVTYNDRHGDDKQLTATASLSVKEAPPEPFAPEFPAEEDGVRSIEEKTDAGVQIGVPVGATDANTDDILTYSLDSASAALFSIETTSGQLSTKAALDYEKRRSYRVRVTATDPSKRSDTITVTINIIDVDEAPELTLVGGDGSAQATAEFYENGTGAVATFRATDPERESIEFDTDNAAFTVDANGALKFVNPPDFELGNTTHTVTVTAREVDDGDASTTENQSSAITLTVNVLDVNEAPVPTAASGTAEKTIVENALTTWTFAANDPENFVVAWSVSGTDGRHFKVSSGGVLEFLSPPDYESPQDSGRDNVYNITLQAFDGHNTGRLPVTVTVTNVEESPQIRFSQIRPVVGVKITATLYDPEVSSPRNLRWEWQGGGGTDGATSTSPDFTPQRDGSILQAIATYLDSEGNSRRVSSIDAGAGEELVRPNPNDQDPPQSNDAPEFTQDTYSFTVPENAGPGSSVGTAGATDDDTFTYGGHGTIADQSALHYSLDRASAAVFDIDRTSGAIQVREPLDFESKSSYSATVTVTDPLLAKDTATVTITVTDVDEPPEITGSEVVFYGSGKTTPVTTFRASDPERGDITWSLSGTDSGLFTLDADSGVLTFNDPPVHDPADTGGFQITVTATDPGGNTDQLQVTVAVTGDPPSAGPSGPPGGGGPGGGGGGGGGGGDGPSPSIIDYEWTVKHDIEALAGGNAAPTGLWSDGVTVWIADNGQGADDEVYAYNAATGARAADREFALDPTNRAPRGFWSDGETVWISDSGRDRLFAYDLAGGGRLEEREIILADGNENPRGIWSGEGVMWVLDGRSRALFAYDLASGRLLARYELDSRNSDPRGIWSDGTTVWVSDHGAKILFAYRLPAPPQRRSRGRVQPRGRARAPGARARRGVHAPVQLQQQQPARHLVGRRRHVRGRCERREGLQLQHARRPRRASRVPEPQRRRDRRVRRQPHGLPG